VSGDGHGGLVGLDLKEIAARLDHESAGSIRMRMMVASAMDSPSWGIRMGMVGISRMLNDE
jgi:hypothetical protein